jgi:hypothetical protein
VSDASPLLREYERLRDRTSSQRRGYDLQALVGSMLGRAHFKVETKARAARPRQVDLFASRGETVYLIETKWRKDKADIDDVDSLYTRLEAVPPQVTGLLVSHAGFAESVLARVREKSARPVILVTGKELEAALQWDGAFVGLLRQKASALLVHREVLVDADVRPSRRAGKSKLSPGDLPASDRTFVFPDGTRSRWLSCEGDFGRFTFVSELADIDWVPGSGLGVNLDIALHVQDQTSLRDLLGQLAKMGWITPKGCWSIQQATRNWHGFGADALAETLRTWRRRYEGLETHHTEELCYTDECEDGFYSLVAQLSADSRRFAWRVGLSFQLRGIPLDTGPYRELGAHFGLSDPVYFRPRSEASRIWGRPNRKCPVVKPVAFVVLLENLLPGNPDDDDEWVSGIVVENPFLEPSGRAKRHPKWVPDMVTDSEYLVCALRSWHTLDNPKAVYELWAFESAWTSDALVVRAMADWPDEPDEASTETPTRDRATEVREAGAAIRTRRRGGNCSHLRPAGPGSNNPDSG